MNQKTRRARQIYNCHKKRKGVKVHVAVSTEGLPLSIITGPGNEHDSKRFVEVLGMVRIGIGRGGILEMTSFSQSPRDRILWILANNGGKMERSRLRAATGIRYALLNPILEKLVRECRIKLTDDLVILINRGSGHRYPSLRRV